MEIIFLDANVIANWILINMVKEKNKEIRKDKILRERFRHISYSYTTIEALHNNAIETKTSDLAIAETYKVIYTEFINLDLYRKGVPMVLWPHNKLRKNYDLTEDMKFEVKNKVETHLKELKRNVKILRDKIDKEIFPKLILDYNMETHDAMLLTTAILNNCSLFLTNDGKIIDLKNKKRDGRKFGDIFRIDIDKPENFIKTVRT